MTYQPDEGGFPQICPFLGLGDDADSHATYATEAHRCYNLQNPTKIALQHQETYCLVENHVTCPVYQGQGVPQAGAAAAATPEPFGTPRTRPAQPSAPAAVAGAGAARGAASSAGGGRAGTPPNRRQPTLSPKPRGGGISMPVATIALFGLAVLVIAVAVLVTQLADGGDGDDLTQAEIFQTTQAQRTQAPAETTTATGATTPGTGPTQAGASPTTGTPAARTATIQPNGGGTTHIVESGEFCSTIANLYDITLEELLEANDMTEDDCTSLQVDDELVIPD